MEICNCFFCDPPKSEYEGCSRILCIKCQKHCACCNAEFWWLKICPKCIKIEKETIMKNIIVLNIGRHDENSILKDIAKEMLEEIIRYIIPRCINCNKTLELWTELCEDCHIEKNDYKDYY